MVEPIHIQALHLRSTASTFILAHFTNFSMMLVLPAQCLASLHHQRFWTSHSRVSFTSLFSLYFPLLAPMYLLHSPSGPYVSFYIPLLAPTYLLHPPSCPYVSFTSPFSQRIKSSQLGDALPTQAVYHN